MAELILVRHAPTAWTGRRFCGWSDPRLDVEGRRVATVLAREVAAIVPPGVMVVSSPLRRARETADAVAGAVGAGPIVLDGRWREVDVGIADGRTFDELARLAPDLADRLANGDPAIDWPDGETAVVFARRVGDAVLAWQADPVPMIVVTHAGPMRLAMSILRDRPVDEVELPAPATIVRFALEGSLPPG